MEGIMNFVSPSSVPSLFVLFNFLLRSTWLSHSSSTSFVYFSLFPFFLPFFPGLFPVIYQLFTFFSFVLLLHYFHCDLPSSFINFSASILIPSLFPFLWFPSFPTSPVFTRPFPVFPNPFLLSFRICSPLFSFYLFRIRPFLKFLFSFVIFLTSTFIAFLHL